MMAETAKRNYRSKEERIAEIEQKIETHRANIAVLEGKKAAILNPAPRRKRVGVGTVLKAAKESGMTPEEIANKLGIKL